VHLGYFRTEWRDHTRSAARAKPLWLRSSPELQLKQLMAKGAKGVKGAEEGGELPRIYEIAPCWRNDGELSAWHHPEFTMLEWYRAGASFTSIVDETEALIRECHGKIAAVAAAAGLTPGQLPRTFERVTVAEAFRRWAGIELVDGDAGLAGKAVKAGCPSVRPDDDFETAFFKVLLDKVEAGLTALGGGVLVDYPASQAALATVEGGVAKRFEFYWGPVELCNGFLELTDPGANRGRIRGANAKRRALGHEVTAEDEAFYEALPTLPACAGNALGFDRLVALCAGLAGIAEVVPARGLRTYE
jgi:lysyl-tRNA synthetase class 2